MIHRRSGPRTQWASRALQAWLAVLASALLAACGGGADQPGTEAPAGAPTTPGHFTALVTFGDSLSDQGTYAPATSLVGGGQPPYFGGKFTVNLDDNGGLVWLENVAAALGLAVLPAEVGFAGSSVKCPARFVIPAAAALCTSYGQGGARVTDPAGIGRDGGALTVPVVTQVANHLAAFGGRFKADDLVIVWAGNNDVFIQFGGFAAAAQAIQADALAGKISADQAKKRLYDAQTAAQQGLKDAAQQLTALVRGQILAKGGRYVMVFNLPDSADTPFGSTLDAEARGVLSTLVDTFNLWLRDGLGGQPVLLVDQHGYGKAVAANPAGFGLAVTAVPACDAAAIQGITGGQVTDGSSLFCNGTPGMVYNGLRAGASASTWQFADGVHPTPGGHRVISDYVITQLRHFGWI